VFYVAFAFAPNTLRAPSLAAHHKKQWGGGAVVAAVDHGIIIIMQVALTSSVSFSVS